MHRVLLILVLGLSSTAFANDGRDRYRGVGPNLLMLFPEPLPGELGYRFLPRDMPGGADGDPAFRWAQPRAIALVRLAADQVAKKFGPSKNGATVAVFDCAAENGDTPVGFAPGKPPRGRHPGGSHDGGLNLDLGYYLTSLVGRHYTPDHAACTDHFEKQAEKAPAGSETPADLYRCVGVADRLDLDRQAYFLLRLFELDMRYTQGEWIDEIGIDGVVRAAVLDRVQIWKRQGKNGATKKLLVTMQASLVSDRWEGWASSHHHHIHLRLLHLKTSGRYRHGFRRLLNAARTLDRRLLGVAAKGKAAKGTAQRGHGFLRTRLLSVGVRRAVEFDLYAHGGVSAVRFEAAGRKADPDPARHPCLSGVIDLPAGPSATASEISVEAELTLTGGQVRRLQETLRLPRAEAHLWVEVNPAFIRPQVDVFDHQIQARFEMPQPYFVYFTGLTYEIHRGGSAEMESLKAGGLGHTMIIQRKNKAGRPLHKVDAVLTFSSRYEIRLPIFINKPS